MKHLLTFLAIIAFQFQAISQVCCWYGNAGTFSFSQTCDSVYLHQDLEPIPTANLLECWYRIEGTQPGIIETERRPCTDTVAIAWSDLPDTESITVRKFAHWHPSHGNQANHGAWESFDRDCPIVVDIDNQIELQALGSIQVTSATPGIVMLFDHMGIIIDHQDTTEGVESWSPQYQGAGIYFIRAIWFESHEQSVLKVIRT